MMRHSKYSGNMGFKYEQQSDIKFQSVVNVTKQANIEMTDDYNSDKR